jgi:hypothetical protein
MDAQEIRLIVRRKLQDGRLPYDSIPRFWGGLGDGEQWDVCETLITKEQLVMEGIASVSPTRTCSVSRPVLSVLGTARATRGHCLTEFPRVCAPQRVCRIVLRAVTARPGAAESARSSFSSSPAGVPGPSYARPTWANR